MKIILTQEVSGLGTPGDIVEVKDGYGRNYLLPQGFAIRLDQGRREAGRRSSSGPASAREIRDLGQANEVKGQLEGLKVTLTARVRHRRPAVRLDHPGRDRRRGQGRRRSGAGPASARAAGSHQDHGRVQRPGQAAPRGDREVPGERGRPPSNTALAERRVGPGPARLCVSRTAAGRVRRGGLRAGASAEAVGR